MITFSYLESTYRTNFDASIIERLNPLSGDWVQTFSLGIRAEAKKVIQSKS